jgi:radical SAM superfamily enzyme YgiQ (UPF0313 family)
MGHITFLNIPSHKETVSTLYPPIGILCMSSTLKQRKHTVAFIDADAQRYTIIETINKIKEKLPTIIGITLNVSQIYFATKYIEKIKEEFPKIPIVVGGPYVSAIQNKIFENIPKIDYAIVGEGDYAIVDLIDYLEGRIKINEVRNLLYLNKKRTIVTRLERIGNLDELPLPDYDLIKESIDKYSAPYPYIALPSLSIMCTRGCPFNCTFCSSPKTWQRKVTFRSTDAVITEVELLKNMFNVKEIFFQDDTLNARPEWFMELCDKIIRKGLNKDIFFKCPFRANENIITKKLLKKAKEANFWMIFYGVENGNQKMLDSMNKNIKVKEIIRAFRLTKEAGICTYASFMIGNYGENINSVKDSFKLLDKILPDYGGFAAAIPFPGTELYNLAKKENLMNINNFNDSEIDKCTLRTKELDYKEIIELTKLGNEKFQNIPKQLRYWFKTKIYGLGILRKIVGEGIYEPEKWDRVVRRTGKNVSIALPIQNSPKKLLIEMLADYPNLLPKGIVLKLKINKKKFEFVLKESTWKTIEIPLSKKDLEKNNYLDVEWEVNRTWCPKIVGINNDPRELGVTISKLVLVK